MYTFLLILLVLDALFMGLVILLQAGKGGGLAAMGGGVAAAEGILGGRQATTVLTRATWISGGTFMLLALILSILSSRSSQPRPILQDQFQPVVPAPEPLLPGAGGGAGGPEGAGSSGEKPGSPENRGPGSGE